MKSCTALCFNGLMMGAFLFPDHLVLFPFCCEGSTAKPVVVVEGKSFYAPKDALGDYLGNLYELLPFEMNNNWGCYDVQTGKVKYPLVWSCLELSEDQRDITYLHDGECHPVARFNQSARHIPYQMAYDTFVPEGLCLGGQWGLLSLHGKI